MLYFSTVGLAPISVVLAIAAGKIVTAMGGGWVASFDVASKTFIGSLLASILIGYYACR